MELPSALRAALDEALNGLTVRELAAAATRLSDRYRAETRDGQPHVSSDQLARAYLATRMPATYAAVRAALAQITKLRPDFSPETLLDIGAGPGTALWAAADAWPELRAAELIEASPSMRTWGESFSSQLSRTQVTWYAEDLTAGLPGRAPRDLVTLAYVLSELSVSARDQLILRLWELTDHTLLLVEPGTPAGWKRILRARQQLLEAGAYFVAPCPHANECPLSEPDWCHFSRRVARTRVHRQAKGGTVPWEDEKFSYFVASRHAGPTPDERLIATPRHASGRVSLRICSSAGADVTKLLSKRDGVVYRKARRADWGDGLWTGEDGADS